MWGDKKKDQKIAELEKEIIDLKLNKKGLEEEIDETVIVSKKEKLELELSIDKEKRERAIIIKEKEAEFTKKFADEYADVRENNQILEQENAKLKATVEMMEKVVDVSADIIDIKDLVSKLIEKLPNVNLDKMTVNVENKVGKK